MWKVIPSMTFLDASSDGRVRVNDDLVKINEYVNYKGYKVIRVKSPYGHFIRMKHRLIGNAWLKDFNYEFDINHKDISDREIFGYFISREPFDIRDIKPKRKMTADIRESRMLTSYEHFNKLTNDRITRYSLNGT